MRPDTPTTRTAPNHPASGKARTARRFHCESHWRTERNSGALKGQPHTSTENFWAGMWLPFQGSGTANHLVAANWGFRFPFVASFSSMVYLRARQPLKAPVAERHR